LKKNIASEYTRLDEEAENRRVFSSGNNLFYNTFLIEVNVLGTVAQIVEYLGYTVPDNGR